PHDLLTSKRRPGHHRPSRSPARVPSGPPPSRRQDLTDLHPGATLSWPKNHVFRRRFVRIHPNFQLKFSFVSPPNRSSKALEPDRTAKETFKGSKAVEVRRIHHRAIHSFRVSKPESFH
ncbi:hypothetical protein Prudu_128S000700, partial [Prunus dulcis]